MDHRTNPALVYALWLLGVNTEAKCNLYDTHTHKHTYH